MGDRQKLEESWARTTAHLMAACDILPTAVDKSWVEDFLHHNELELALDDLEVMADDLEGLSVEFWKQLSAAAKSMGLGQHFERYEARIAGDDKV